MIKLEGKIVKVFESQKKSEKFSKRLFWLEGLDTEFPNTWQLELWNRDMGMIDSYQLGDLVTCFVDVRGKKWTKSDGTESIETIIKCWNFEKEGKLHKQI